EKNDGCTETAISLGKANFSCFWNFGESTPTDDYISIDINEDFEISIAYENGELMTLLVEKEKAKNILDY
ncbi:MAG: hypothetical protein LIP01_06510, partial [Tannerellaceae bacterium]|nr:hypothetical protein [Tannerellaceae bacterium]